MKEIFSAFIKAQAEIKGATKDSKNPHFNSKYADIESVIEAIKIPLANNNLAFFQPIFSEGDRWYMNTILIHETGQQIESGKVELIIKDKNNPQSLKSSVTYFRRTCLLSMCGIPDIDDDGNAGSTKPYTSLIPKPPAKVALPPVESYVEFIFKNGQFKDKHFHDIEPSILDKYMKDLAKDYSDKPMNETTTNFFEMYNQYVKNRGNK